MATLASVICSRERLKRANPKRCFPVRSSRPEGASTGPFPPVSFNSSARDLPSGFGKSCAFAAGGAC